MYPGFMDSLFVCNFINYEKQLATSRTIANTGKYRYRNNGNQMYFFQQPNFDKYTRLVLTEGPFDSITTYLYNKLFQGAFFSAICGNSYLSAVERLIVTELLIGYFEINIIFDNDIKNDKLILYRITKLAKHYNENIIIKGFKPLLSLKDVGEFPAVKEVSLGKHS